MTLRGFSPSVPKSRKKVTCINLLDSHTVLARDGFVGTYNAEEPTPFQPSQSFNDETEFLSSRTFRGGVRISF
jgi:hypothetical protein